MRVLFVDDHILFREGMVSMFKAEPDFEIVGQAGSVREAIDLARMYKPDLILMDFSLPDGSGADASSVILAEQPGCKIIFLTVYETDEKLFDAIRAGAKGYLLKNTPLNKVLASIRGLEMGEAAISSTMTMRLMQEFSRIESPATKPDLLDNLSPRELEVLREMATGASNAEIADCLFLSLNTVKHHVGNILTKLQATNRHSAIKVARREGIIK